MLITVGRIVKPYGVAGEVKIEPVTDFPGRFKGLRSVHLVSQTGKELICEIQNVRYAGGSPYIRFKDFDTPEKAKALNGWFVKVPAEEAVPLPEGMYYWFELIGMEVVSESGERFGSIVDIFETGSNDVYVVKHGKKEIYVPATREVVKEVDRKAKRMVIHLMDGLIE
ncbi:MAG TPA: ribosome maturation factor RimM [Nitrospirota bacterium]|nr:ribosome maturation factor RimM [Nitrospirota bacterium]